MKGFHLLYVVVRSSGAQKVILWFLAVYFACAAVIALVEPGVDDFGDGLWFLWAVATTVGLGDVTAVTPLGRAATIICSLAGIVTVAIITAVVVDYFNERRDMMLDESTALMLDKLEHLEDLEKEELAEISKKMRKLRS